MFDTIVIGVDGRKGSADALALAQRIAGPGARRVAVSIAHGSGGTAQAEKALRGALAEHHGMESSVFVAESVATGLHQVAREIDAGLLVLGSCHRSGVGRLVLGNDATETAHDAPCPVAVAPRDLADTADQPIRAIGVGFDGSDAARAALAVARSLARDLDAAVHVRHVITDRPSDAVVAAAGSVGAAIDQARTRAQATLDALGDDVDGQVQAGDPAGLLLRFATEMDLLVLGFEHHGATARVFLGSVADAVARRSPAPLLLVPLASAAAEGSGTGTGTTTTGQ